MTRATQVLHLLCGTYCVLLWREDLVGFCGEPVAPTGDKPLPFQEGLGLLRGSGKAWSHPNLGR
jgi:hypothetical protein